MNVVNKDSFREMNTKISFDAVQYLVSNLVIRCLEILHDKFGHLLLPQGTNTFNTAADL